MTFKALSELAVSLFSELKDAKFVFQYRDDEGDLITITSDAELKEAIRVTGSNAILRLTVSPVVPKEAKSKCGEDKCTPNSLEAVLQQLANRYLPLLCQVLECPELNQFNSFVPMIKALIERYLPLLFQGRQRRCERYRASSCCPSTSSSTAAMHRASCDGCNRRIFNVRYKCNECPDYDLCEECKQKTGVHTADHTFVKITDPKAPVHPAICDHCNNYIVGLRFKCNSCMDYDLCEKCIQLKGVHDATHAFTKIETPFSRCPAARRRCCRMNRNQCPVPVETQTVQKEEVKPTEKKEETKPIEKKEEPKPVEIKQEVKKEEVKKVEQLPKPVEAPKVEKKQEPAVAHPFEVKLKQLEEMGFGDRARNISLLVHNKMDLVKTIRDLLEQ